MCQDKSAYPGIIKTTGLAGGLIRPFKGLVLAKRLKAHRKICQPLNLSQAAPNGAVFTYNPLWGYFLPFSTGSPVNGSISSFMLI